MTCALILLETSALYKLFIYLFTYLLINSEDRVVCFESRHRLTFKPVLHLLCYPLSTILIFLFKNHRSLIALCISCLWNNLPASFPLFSSKSSKLICPIITTVVVHHSYSFPLINQQEGWLPPTKRASAAKIN